MSVVLANIRKTYGNTVALRGVSLDIEHGEIHALLGANGSGKSSLVKVLTGAVAADPGSRIVIRGQEIQARRFTTRQAQSHGIRVVHQEAPLIGSLTVAEHYGVTFGFPTIGSGLIRQSQLDRLARAALEHVDADVDPRALAHDLTAAQRAQVSLALAMAELSAEDSILVLDEATALLSTIEAAPILSQVARLAEQGAAVVMITHRLSEVLDHAHRVTVLREGTIALGPTTSIPPRNDLVAAMVGRTAHDATQPARTPGTAFGEFVSVSGLSGRHVRDCSFVIGRGEIVGLGGVKGAGADEVARMVAGAEPARAGELVVDGHRLRAPWSVRDALRRGICYLPQDRHAEGGILTLSAADNLMLPRFPRRPRTRRPELERMIARLHVRPAEPERPLSDFSGGNQQKILLGKWLLMNPRLLILDDPTYGVDPGARRIIMAAVREFAGTGASVLFLSTEPDQIAALCDRVIVLRDGRVAGELTGDSLNETEVSLASAG